LLQIARYRREKNVADPMAYRLLRIGIWLPIEQLPQSDDSGETEIPAIPYDRKKPLDALVQAGASAAVVQEAETILATAPFWLDGHQLVASTLQSLGHVTAQLAVIESMRAFIGRFPQLPELKFKGGAPFASESARLWIRATVLSVAAARSEQRSVPQPVETDSSPWLQAAQAARHLAASGDVKAAIRLLQEGKAKAQGERECFLWGLEQARFCQEVGLVDLAVTQLEHLDEQAQKYRLEEWEPPLILETALALAECYTGMLSEAGGANDLAAKLSTVTARICRLDVCAALELPHRGKVSANVGAGKIRSSTVKGIPA
jgi:type VI secretion system protein VasJ